MFTYKGHNLLSFNIHFTGVPRLAGIYQDVCILDFIGAKGDGGGDDSWSCKT